MLFVGFGLALQDRVREAFNKQKPGFLPVFAASPEAAFATAENDSLTAIVIDQASGAVDGFAFLKRLMDAKLAIPTLMLTLLGDEKTVLRALAEGVDECLAVIRDDFGPLPIVLDRVLARQKYKQSTTGRERAIIQSTKQWSEIIDSITDFIYIIDNEFKLVKMNKAFAAVFGAHPKDLIGKRCFELLGNHEVCKGCNRLAVLEQGASCITTEQVVKGVLYQVSAFPMNAQQQRLTVHVLKNVTELHQLKDRLYHADKLASLGLLVAGVAHEINNPLTGIIAYAELLRMKAPPPDLDAELKKILESADKCKRIVENLLAFSRQKAPVRSIESINEIIDRTIELRSYWLRRENIEIIRQYGELPSVYVDLQQIQQVVLNILLNAEQAISGTGRGMGQMVFTTSYDRDAKNVTIRISDDGPGVPRDVVDKVFDPFFTTKSVGVGTGLGLSIAHGIMAEHGGDIRIESIEKKGTTVIMRLPTGADVVRSSVTGNPGNTK